VGNEERTNLSIHGVEERVEIESKSTKDLFNQIIAEKISNIRKDTDTHVQKEF
jgi:hypothetical protein